MPDLESIRRELERLRTLIRDVPDFPKPGVTFRDFTPLLADAPGLALAVELMANPFRGKSIDLVVGAESRGFIFGTAIAQSLSAGFVPIRKQGKLPRETRSVSYSLEYGNDQLQIHADAIPSGARVLLVDDLVATGGTLGACVSLLESSGATMVGISVLIELAGLGGRAVLPPEATLHSVIRY